MRQIVYGCEGASAALLVLAVLNAGCDGSKQQQAPIVAPPVVQTFTHDGYRVSFELPQDWQQTARGDSVTFFGPEDSPAFFTTLSLQALQRQPRGLDEVLLAAYGGMPGDVHASWEARDPTTVAARPALSYRMNFIWHETPRKRAGILVDTGDLLVDLSYVADHALFDHSLPVFMQCVQSLSVF